MCYSNGNLSNDVGIGYSGLTITMVEPLPAIKLTFHTVVLSKVNESSA